jgi:signal transduction histidine kinase
VLNLTDVIAGDERLIRQLIGEHVQLVLHLDPALRLVLVDACYIDQIVLNLTVNARDAMPEGGILTVSTNNVEISAESNATVPSSTGLPPGLYVQLTVTDTGAGMNTEVRGHIFEPFFTTKPRGKGTGLGLSTVYGNVRQSDGHIAVETEPGAGTTVRIFLPSVSAGTTPAQEPRSRNEIPHEPEASLENRAEVGD